jgi:hypothetical protein
MIFRFTQAGQVQALRIGFMAAFAAIVLPGANSRAQYNAVYDISTTPEKSFGLGPVRAAAFSPDGSRILCGTGAFGLVYDANTGVLLHGLSRA